MAQSEAATHEHQKDTEDVLYSHKMRPHWGRGVLAWDRGDKRGFQFEDGKLRVISAKYLHLLAEKEVDGEKERQVLSALRRKVGWRQEPRRKRPAERAVAVPLHRQIELFARLYPKGFAGVRWAREKRGIDATRRLKRHRDAAIHEAQRLLSESRLVALRGVGKHELIVKSMREVCDGTSLVSKSQLRVLDEIDESGAAQVSGQLESLLYGEAAFGIRFERFVDTLARTTGKRPTWPLATALLALVQPKEHICIKPSSMRRQVACAGRLIQVSAAPTAPIYERLGLMVEAIRAELVKAGAAPRDLIDVYDFIETTTTPKALRQMSAEEARSAA